MNLGELNPAIDHMGQIFEKMLRKRAKIARLNVYEMLHDELCFNCKKIVVDRIREEHKRKLP